MVLSQKNLLVQALTCTCAALAVSAQAQVLDELELRQEGNNAVVQIRFVTPVQYARSISSRASDLVQVFYKVLPTRAPLQLTSSERRLPGGGAIAAIEVRDGSAVNTLSDSTNRKLVVRFGAATAYTVRAGRDRNSIEVVLVGKGSSVKEALIAKLNAVPPKPTAAAPAAVLADSPINPEAEAAAAALLTTAQAAFDSGQYDAATESLNQLLNLPPNMASRKAQEMAGLARLNAGDKARAASEFDLFLKLYPTGEDSDRIRQLVTSLPSIGATTVAEGKPKVEATSVTSGSVSSFFYGGKSDTRTQEFQDSQLGGLPILQSETTLANTDQKQWQNSVDLNWRYRDAEKDMRIVVRDSLTRDYLKSSNTERLRALYFDYRSLNLGGSVRVGRQSPTGGGVMYRFDGVQAGYTFAPKWKVNGVMGKPSDDLLDTRRTFYGVSLDADALTKSLSASTYLIEQVIDGVTDRRGVGADLRYFQGGVSATGQFDYDTINKGVNIAALQSTWQVSDTTALNVMFDRRTTPLLSLGNVLFFQDPNLAAPAKRITELLGTTPIETLRDQVKGLTAYQSQFRVGGTTAISEKWQTGADFSLTSVDEIKPVAVLLPNGQAATGNLWGVSTQLIGTNLYSARDTHVFNVSFLGGPAYHGTLLSYNNLTSLGDKWQLEPSLKYYTQSGSAGDSTSVWGTGLRATYRIHTQVSLESELTYERSNRINAPTPTGPGATEQSARLGYYLGGRFEF